MSLKSISLPKIAYLYIELCVLNHISTTPPILKTGSVGFARNRADMVEGANKR